jgi:hypothetical protein
MRASIVGISEAPEDYEFRFYPRSLACASHSWIPSSSIETRARETMRARRFSNRAIRGVRAGFETVRRLA